MLAVFHRRLKETPVVVESHGPFVRLPQAFINTRDSAGGLTAQLIAGEVDRVSMALVLGGSLAAMAAVKDGCGSLAALVDVEGNCCCSSLVAAGEGSCDSLVADQSRTTARQQQTAGSCWCADIAYSSRTRMIQNTYVRT